MKKLIKVLVSCSFLALALIFVAGTVSSKLGLASRDIAHGESTVGHYDEQEDLSEQSSVVFDSLDDYLAYLASEGIDSEDDPIYYNAPASVPVDAVLKSISNSDEGTVYCYYFGRDAVMQETETNRENDNVISFDLGDELLDDLTHYSIIKYYGNSLNNVTDYEAFAEALAEAIGSPLVSSGEVLDTYIGSIYADIYDPVTQIKTRYLVGQQRVLCMHMTGHPVSVAYSYVPASVSASEATLLMDMTQHELLPNNNE